MWYDYRTGVAISKRIAGLRKVESIRAAKLDGGCGVVLAPDGRKVYWQS